MLFHEWTDFVVYSLAPNRVRSMSDRLDVSTAYRIGNDGRYATDYSPRSSRGAVVDCSMVLAGDVFECMEVDEGGRVTIWTRDKVWFLTREGSGGCIEKLRYVPRNPPQNGTA